MAALAAASTVTVSGCTLEENPVRKVVEVFSGGYSLTEQDHWSLARMNQGIDVAMAGAPAGERNDAKELFRDVYVRVRSGYVNEPNADTLVEAALKGLKEDPKIKPGRTEPDPAVERALDAMMASLDPHSAYYNPDEYRESRISTRGEFGGLGISVRMEDDAVKVVSPIKGTPAERAGLLAGDLITHLDGDSVKGLTLMDAVRVMRGTPGTAITLTIRRGKQAPFDLSITRAVIVVKAVEWRMEGDIGYIKVGQFNQTVVETFIEAMEGIEAATGGKPKGIVLDMRGNRGGLLNQSVALADAFLPDGVIVSAKGRRDDSNQYFTAVFGDMAETVPVVVLIDAATASAAEIVTAALKDHGRAVVLGEQSFGKGSVQTILPLINDGAVKITTALYYSPSGRAIQAQGIIPNVSLTPPNGVKPDADASPYQREDALPGALPAVGGADAATHAKLSLDRCPAAGEDGKDQALGCALQVLRLGGEAKFLSAYGLGSAGL